MARHWLLCLMCVVAVFVPKADGALRQTTEGSGQAPGRYCLACLCSATTGCDMTIGCKDDEGRVICGPFYISRPFWQDSNVTAIARFREYDFRRCANDAECAAEAVSSYMTNFSQDCDGDGRITCRDYGLMHWLGYSQCTAETQRREAERTLFFTTFERCLRQVDGLLAAGIAQASLPGCESLDRL